MPIHFTLSFDLTLHIPAYTKRKAWISCQRGYKHVVLSIKQDTIIVAVNDVIESVSDTS